jgi:hypothetical protein
MYMPANSYLTRTIPDCTEAGIPWQCMVILHQGSMKPVRTTRSYRSLPDLAMAIVFHLPCVFSLWHLLRPSARSSSLSAHMAICFATFIPFFSKRRIDDTSRSPLLAIQGLYPLLQVTITLFRYYILHSRLLLTFQPCHVITIGLAKMFSLGPRLASSLEKRERSRQQLSGPCS